MVSVRLKLCTNLNMYQRIFKGQNMSSSCFENEPQFRREYRKCSFTRSVCDCDWINENGCHRYPSHKMGTGPIDCDWICEHPLSTQLAHHNRIKDHFRIIFDAVHSRSRSGPKIITKWPFILLWWANCDSGYSQIQSQSMGPVPIFLRQVSTTPIIINPIAVAVAQCEGALMPYLHQQACALCVLRI